MDKAMHHLIASTEYKDGVKWAITKCGERYPVAGSESSKGLAMPDPCPVCYPKGRDPCSSNIPPVRQP